MSQDPTASAGQCCSTGFLPCRPFLVGDESSTLYFPAATPFVHFFSRFFQIGRQVRPRTNRELGSPTISPKPVQGHGCPPCGGGFELFSLRRRCGQRRQPTRIATSIAKPQSG